MRRALVVLQVLAVVVLGMATVARFHVWADVDERPHYDYVQAVAEHGRLPELDRPRQSRGPGHHRPDVAGAEPGRPGEPRPGGPLLRGLPAAALLPRRRARLPRRSGPPAQGEGAPRVRPAARARGGRAPVAAEPRAAARRPAARVQRRAGGRAVAGRARARHHRVQRGARAAARDRAAARHVAARDRAATAHAGARGRCCSAPACSRSRR